MNLNQVKRTVITAILANDALVDRLVLKGGNLLQFAYEISSRASKDIDISIDGEFEDVEWLRASVCEALEKSFAKMGIVVFDFSFVDVPARLSDDLKAFWGGYKCEFKVVSRDIYEEFDGDTKKIRRRAQPLDAESGSTKFKIDFSRHEFCEDKEEFVVDDYTIYGYSPRMFVAEKLRAICQQMPEYNDIVVRTRPPGARARDFVDIHVIVARYGIDFGDDGFHSVIQKTFAVKRVPVEWIGRIKNCYDQHESDFESVRATVAPNYELREFSFYFTWLCRQCELLEALWRE